MFGDGGDGKSGCYTDFKPFMSENDEVEGRG